MNPSAYGRSIIRTVVPIIVGSVIAWLAARGVKVDEATILPAVDAIAAAAARDLMTTLSCGTLDDETQLMTL